MAKFMIIIFLLLFPITSFAGNDWSKEDTLREITWQSIHLMDWGQTLEVARNPDKYYEINPLMGRHPSVSKVNLYMGTLMVVHLVISYVLPKKWRKVWQYTSIGVSSAYVINNFNVGLKVKF